MKPKSKILIIAGSDSSGGAGIQADIKTVTSLGSYALTAITAVTVQNTKGVKSVIAIPPNEIKNQILSSLKNKNLSNKKILITSGATIERIDPVRYISNDSSGIQGTSIANALIRKGAEVIFVTGKSTYEKPLGAKIINVESAREMYDAVFKNGPYNVAICAAAVSDWYVDNKNSKKIIITLSIIFIVLLILLIKGYFWGK